MNNKFSIVEINSSEQMSAALKIREQIFIREQGIPAELENDDLDDKSDHIIAYHDTAAVATARLTINPDKSAILARVAVLPEYRGEGLGRLLVLKLEQIARENQVREISLHPHQYLEKFYNDLGYHRIEGGQIVGGNTLIKMCKLL